MLSLCNIILYPQRIMPMLSDGNSLLSFEKRANFPFFSSLLAHFRIPFTISSSPREILIRFIGVLFLNRVHTHPVII